MGNWIGGDPRRQSQCRRRDPQDGGIPPGRVALRHYLVEIHQLGGELSVCAPSGRFHPRLQALADRSGDPKPTARGRALPARNAGIYARLDGTLRSLTGVKALRHILPPASRMQRPLNCSLT